MKPLHLIACFSLLGCLAPSAQAFIIIDPLSTGATDVVQDPNGTPVLLANPLADPLLLGGDELAVGNTAAGDFAIDKGSDVTSQSGYIGKVFGSTGSAIVDGLGSTWTNTIDLFVGNSGGGTLSISDSASVIGVRGIVGRFDNAVGTATVDGGASTWMNSGDLVIGSSGDGTMTIQNGGNVSNEIGYVGRFNTATGMVTVTGTGSTWANSADLFVGNSGNGTMTVSNGAMVSNVNGFIGQEVGSVSLATVSGTGSTWTSSNQLTVGNLGDGTLSILNGGSVSATTAATSTSSYVGRLSGSTGLVTVDGIGSTLTTNSAGFNDLVIGAAGDGTLNIQNGGSVANWAARVGELLGSNGAVTIDGPGSTWTSGGSLRIGDVGDGTLTIQNGGTLSSGSTRIANASGSTGQATVDGIGSTWTAPSGIRVGDSGNGTLTIQNGGSISANSAVIGFSSGATGLMTVTGVGSTWTSDTSGMLVGNRGDGTLLIQNGASATALFGTVGALSGGTGQATVDGVGSTWNLTSDFPIPSDLTVGESGNGTLTIQNGGAVSSTAGTIGADSGSIGSVTVNGAGSTWTLTTNQTFQGDLTVANAGNGTLLIQAGAGVSNVAGTIGAVSGSTGAVTVDGIGSTWTNSADLTVGNVGNGTLLIQNGGSVSNTFVSIASTASSTSSATVDGAGTAWVIPGSLSIGGTSTDAGGIGTLNIQNSGLVQVDGTFKIWTNGTANLGGGTLDLNGPFENGGGTLNFTAGVMNINDPTVPLIAGGSDNTLGGLSLGSSFALNTGQTLNMAGSSRVDFGGQLTLGGGTLNTPSLLLQTGGSVVNNTGSSTVTSPVLALAGSTISVTGGDLTIGDTAAVNGFASAGTTNVGNNTLTLLDANDAVFDSLALATLGDGIGGAGTLAAANGLTLNFGGNVAGFGTVNTPNDPFKPFINNGNITGNSALEPITLSGYVKGVGTLNNVVITGTDAPGFSPASVFRGSVAYAGTLAIEIGGLTAGSFDLVNHSGTATLGGTLDLSLINGFAPSLGDTFQFLTASSLVGTFASITGTDLGGGLAFDVLYNANDVTLQVISTLLAGDLNSDGFVGVDDLNIVLINWNQTVTPGDLLSGDPTGEGFVGVDDLNIVLINWNNGTPPGAPGESANIPEPGTLVLLGASCAALLRRSE